MLYIIAARPHFLLQAIIRTMSPISLASNVHVESQRVVGGLCGAPVLAVGILIVCARVIPLPSYDEREPTVPLLSTSRLCDSARQLCICALNENA